MHLALAFLTLSVAISSAAEIGPALAQAHAHNDYEQQRPLLDALSHGFTSVEADIHLVAGELLVAHDLEKVERSKTLEALYLNPLAKFARGGKSIFSSGETLTLLVDIKSGAEPTYEKLKPLLARYSEILTRFEPNLIATNAVTIILSGNRPRELLLREEVRYVAYDGRLPDLGKKNVPVSFMPLVSDNWNTQFTWKGEGALPQSEKDKLRSLVQQAHLENRRIRFWATPETPAAWAELRSAGVDLINTDDLGGLAALLRR